jgi:TetR/AcrR family transcriptional repressor of mexJK operon
MATTRTPIATNPGAHAGEDPRIARSRAAIVAGATEAFLENGFDRTSVDDIAAAAGVAKRTVYNVFGDKESLFRAVLGEAIDTAESYAERLAAIRIDTADPEQALMEIGRDLAEAIMGSRVVPLRRLLIAEVPQFPQLAIDYYERAPGLVMRTLANTLLRFHEAGTLHVPDARCAGEHFAFLTIGASLDRQLFDVDLGPGVLERARERAEAGVRAFLRAYAQTNLEE